MPGAKFWLAVDRKIDLEFQHKNLGIPRKLRIFNSLDFKIIYKQGFSVINKDLVLYYKRNKTNDIRIGITVSSRIGNAVTRNRIKRIIREVFRKRILDIKSGYDIVLITRKPIKEKSFHEIEKTFIDVLRRAGLYSRNENNSSGAN